MTEETGLEYNRPQSMADTVFARTVVWYAHTSDRP